MRGILTFPCDEHDRLSNASWASDLPLYFLWLFGGQKRQSKHNMAQIASLLVVVTAFFIGLWTLI